MAEIFRQEFKRHEAAEPEVFGFIHHPHPAAADLLQDAVVRDGLADHAHEFYGGRVGKSMKAVELALPHDSCAIVVLHFTLRPTLRFWMDRRQTGS